MALIVNESHLIPVEAGQAVSSGWPQAIGGKPLGVTWHWTVTWDLAVCRHVLGGRSAERKGEASAHYGIGRSFAEGVDRYVSLENRSWHAGIKQTLRWDGRPLENPNYKGSRSTVGIETVTIGYATGGIKAKPDWIRADSPDGKLRMLVQPWTEDQIAMMVEVGKEIVARWPHIRPEDHHGHHDICPGYKVDVSGFPFARVLRGIYDDPGLPDIWSPFWTVEQRQRALLALGYDLGASGADGRWGPRSDAALRRFQDDHGVVRNGMWTTFVSRVMYLALKAFGKDSVMVAGVPLPGRP
jgi:N-acetyl-anhydromuramyl-L-alanine amidase AmpD